MSLYLTMKKARATHLPLAHNYRV